MTAQTLPQTISVSELTKDIKAILEGNFPLIQVKGEISNLKRQSSGHIYFTLKDEGAQIGCCLFAGAQRNVSHSPRDGDEIVVIGNISVYAPRGNYQIIVRNLFLSGEGNLLRQFLELKKSFESKGYFHPDRKKKIPRFARMIGVVTSPTGAVIQDIIHVLKRRSEGFQLILNPVRVQGPGAAHEIAEAILLFNKFKLADVLIVGRGGGSLEDLWAFNEPEVVEAIFSSEIPIISAVGHETDFSLSDFAADLRAPTPSAAAEIVSEKRSDLLAFISGAKASLFTRVHSLLKRQRERLERFVKDPLLKSPLGMLHKKMQDLDWIKERIDSRIRTILDKKKAELESFRKRLEPRILRERLKTAELLLAGAVKKMRVFRDALQTMRDDLSALQEKLTLLNPFLLLKKGYVIASHNKKLVVSKREALERTTLTLQFSDGEIETTLQGK